MFQTIFICWWNFWQHNIQIPNIYPIIISSIPLNYINLYHKRCSISVPDPPSGLSVYVKGGKHAIVSWSPPSQGSYTSFKLKINPLVHIPGKFYCNLYLEFTYFNLSYYAVFFRHQEINLYQLIKLKLSHIHSVC